MYRHTYRLKLPNKLPRGLYVASSSSVSAVLLMGSVERVKNDYVRLERQSVAADAGGRIIRRAVVGRAALERASDAALGSRDAGSYTKVSPIAVG